MFEMIGNFFVSTSNWLPQVLMLGVFRLQDCLSVEKPQGRPL